MDSSSDLEDVIRSLSVSNPKVSKASELEADYEKTEGQRFPYRQLGYNSFVQYLRSIPHVVKLEPPNCPNPDVIPIITKNIIHIENLIAKQKVLPNKRRNLRGVKQFYGGLGIPQRLSKIRYGHNFGHINDVRNGRMSSFNKVAPAVSEAVDPKLSNYCHGASTNDHSVLPEEIDDELNRTFENEDDWISLNRCIDSVTQEQDFEKFDEELISNYTLKKCYKKSLEGSSQNTNSSKGLANKEYLEEECDLLGIGPTMIKNFRTIMSKYPGGIWASELPKKYLEEFHVPLDLQDLGFPSVVSVAASLPNVFTYERASSHDWLLYDARLHRSTKHLDKPYVSDAEDKSYVPNTIIKDITRLVEHQPAGVKSTDLIHLYERAYYKKLDLDALGFTNIEDFLAILKKTITIIKFQDHYVLLYKHQTVKLDEVKPEATQFHLTISTDEMDFAGPDDVLRPGDVIPNQELPHVKVDIKDQSEALLEVEVRVMEVICPYLFYIMLNSKFNDLQNMMDDLDKFYHTEENYLNVPLTFLKENLYCVCKYEGSWHRAKIIDFKSNLVEIEYIDYGTPGTVAPSELRLLQSDFATLPVQAIQSKLIGISPAGGAHKWPTNVCKDFLKMVTDNRLLAYVYGISTKTLKKGNERLALDIVLFDTNRPKEIIINEHMVEKGLAVFNNEQQITQCSNQDSLTAEPFMKEPYPSLVELPNKTQTSAPRRTPKIPPGFEVSVTSEGHVNPIDNYYVPQLDLNYQPIFNRPAPPPWIPPQFGLQYTYHPPFNIFPPTQCYLPPNPYPQYPTQYVHLINSYRQIEPFNIMYGAPLFHTSTYKTHQPKAKFPGYTENSCKPPTKLSLPQQPRADEPATIHTPTELLAQYDEVVITDQTTPQSSNIERTNPSTFTDRLSSSKETDNKLNSTDEQIGGELNSEKQQSSCSSDNCLTPDEVPEIEAMSKQLEDTTLNNNNSKPYNIDGWDEIEIDDTPAKADNYTEDFKQPLDFYDVNETEPQLNFINSIPDKNILDSKNIPLYSNNWKEIFDPDSLNKSTRENETNIDIPPLNESNNSNKKLVQKLEHEGKFFHVLLVDNKRAVLSQEFYPQFINKFNYITILKLVELKLKEFPKIWKKDCPELFAELVKCEISCKAAKSTMLNIGKATISYVDEIPSVFTTLKETLDPELSSKLVEIDK